MRGYPGLSELAQCNHSSPYKTEAGKYRVRKGDVMMEAEIRVISLLEGDHEPRNAGCPSKLEKAKNRFLEPPEQTQP